MLDNTSPLISLAENEIKMNPEACKAITHNDMVLDYGRQRHHCK